MSFDWLAGQLFINELIVLNKDLTKMEQLNTMKDVSSGQHKKLDHTIIALK